MRESVEARRRRILDVAAQHGEVKVAHLAALMNVSMVTIRRDLEALTQECAVERRHGRVVLAGSDVARNPVKSGAQGTIAVLVPERHSYLNEVTLGARQFLEHAGYRVVLHLAPNTANAERHIIEHLRGQNLDGLLLAPRWRTQQEEDDARNLLAELDLPTVLVERHLSSHPALRSVDSVGSDHRHGVHLAVDHLVSAGHRRILLVARQDSPTARAVNTAFVEIMRQHHQVEEWGTVLSAPDTAPVDGDVGSAIEYGATETGKSAHTDFENPRWLEELLHNHGFTAVLIHSDENALVHAQRLSTSGVRIPQDCAVIAYDDTVAGLGSVPLTAVAPPKEEVGQTAAELLGQRIRARRNVGRWTARRIELLPSLEVRAST